MTYKYSRLIDEAHYKDGELPASEKCTYDDGEEEDEVRDLHFFLDQARRNVSVFNIKCCTRNYFLRKYYAHTSRFSVAQENIKP